MFCSRLPLFGDSGMGNATNLAVRRRCVMIRTLFKRKTFFSPVSATFCDDDAHFKFKRRSFPLSLRHIIQELSSSWAQRSAEARQHVWPPARPRRWRRPSSWCFISDTENHTSPSYPARPACLPSRWHLRAMSLVPPPPPLRVDTEIVI